MECVSVVNTNLYSSTPIMQLVSTCCMMQLYTVVVSVDWSLNSMLHEVNVSRNKTKVQGNLLFDLYYGHDGCVNVYCVVCWYHCLRWAWYQHLQGKSAWRRNEQVMVDISVQTSRLFDRCTVLILYWRKGDNHTSWLHCASTISDYLLSN